MVYQAHGTESNVFDRIATGGQATVTAAIEMLEDYGYEKPTNRKELAQALAVAAKEKGEEIKMRMVEFHPDRLFILNNTEPARPAKSPARERDVYKNDCGCHHNDIGPLRTDLIEQMDKKPDIQQFALILVLGIGGLSFLMMILGQVFLLQSKLSKNG